MAKSVFVSYNHAQKDFVRKDLVPVLRAAGCEVFIDHEQFTLGPTLTVNMDACQDRAEVSLLLISAEYLASGNCQHEMQRAIAADPGFVLGKAIAVKIDPSLSHASLPAEITGPNSLYGDLTDLTDAALWQQLLSSLDAAPLGCTAPAWLNVRQQCAAALQGGRSINLCVPGATLKLPPLLDSWKLHYGLDLPVVSLQSAETHTRPGLINALLRALGLSTHVPPKKDDLGTFERQINAAPRPCCFVLERFHNVKDRHEEYGIDFFRSLRFLQDHGKVIFLLHSFQPLASVVPADHPDSRILAEELALT